MLNNVRGLIMYVFISDVCQQEAKTYGIEDKIQQLIQWVENSSYQTFTDLFEMFAHPYYVRKGVAYKFRLLVKMLDIMIDEQPQQIVVFFRIFCRGDKDYNTLFHKADQHGDFFYNQQNLDNLVVESLKQQLNHIQQQPTYQLISPSDSLTYFLQAKTNLLQLQSCPEQLEYYRESASWVYGVRPSLHQTDMEKTFETMQSVLEKGKTEHLYVDDTEILFTAQPPMVLAEAYDMTIDQFSRILPADILLDSVAWSYQQRHQLPFYLNRFQQQVCDKVFGDNQKFPLLVNAPAQQGKTSLLAMLMVHYSFCYDVENQNDYPCLLLCSAYKKDAIRQEIGYYIQQLLHTRQLKEPQTNLAMCCMDMEQLLTELGIDSEMFDAEKYVDAQEFINLWKKAPFIKNNQINDISMTLAWFVIQHLIKGEMGIVGTGKLYSETLDNYSGLTPEIFQTIYQKIWLEWYKPLNDNGYWDMQDALAYINKMDNFPLKYRAILIDDSEQYSKLAIQTVLKCSVWWQQSELFAQSPIIFMGNRFASFPAQLFDWQDEIITLLNRYYQLQHPNEFLEIQRIHYQADFVSSIHYALQMQRSKTNLIKFKQDITSTTELLHTSIYFVDVANKDLVHALLLNKKIPLIVNTGRRNVHNYIKHNSRIFDWFDYIDLSQMDIPAYSVDNLPSKSYQIALLGFVYDEFAQFSQSEQEFAFLSFDERYRLDNRLNMVRLVMQQGLKKIFILGNQQDFELWQQLFAPVMMNDHVLRVPTVEDIYPAYYQQLENMLQQRQDALESGDIEQIFAVALQHFHRYEYQEYLYLLLKICEKNQDYHDYFGVIRNEQQKYLTFSYLWQTQQWQIWLDYAEYCPKSLQGNLIALQIMYDVPVKKTRHQAFIQASVSYVEQLELEEWADFWQQLFIPMMEKLCNQTTDINWLALTNRFHDLREKGVYIPNYLFAMAYHRQQLDDKALVYWKNAEQMSETDELPDIYYQLLLTHAHDWRQTIVPLIHLNKLGELMTTLTTENLNELQAEYWDKILDYLEDEDELEPVLLYLLPKIHNQDILERIFIYCQDTEVMSDNFMTRLQRLKTLQACLSGDWDVVIERLQYYVPVQDTDDILTKLSQVFPQTTKKTMKGPNHSQTTILRNKPPKPQDEVIDILYALNLNPALYLAENVEDFDKYSELPYVKEIFNLIRQILSMKNSDDVDGVLWNADFPEARSLAYLLEKSDNLMDALSMYGNIVHFSQNKTLKVFAIERAYLLLERAKAFLTIKVNSNDKEDDEEYQENVENLENTQKLINYMEKEFGKLLKTVAKNETPPELPILKTDEELVKKILALTDKEHKEMQRLEQEQKNALKEQQAEQERLEREAKQKAEEEEKIQKALLAKQEKERLEKEQAERERQEQQRLAKEQEEQQRLEQERLEQERLAQEQAERERQEQERLAKEQAEQQRLEQERLEQQRLLEEKRQQELSAVEQSVVNQQQEAQPILHNMTETAQNLPISPTFTQNSISPTTATKATSELQFFQWRIFVARLHQRINIEDTTTGQRCSIYWATGTIQSDWQYQQHNGRFEFTHLPLVITTQAQQITLFHVEHGIQLTIC